jgi:anti-sigma factor ChrR (cupin superfamily)
MAQVSAIACKERQIGDIQVDEWKARPDRPVEVPLQCLRLGEQLERLRQEPTWRTSGRNAITLAKEPALRVVLMLLGKGTKISEHQAAGPLALTDGTQR